METDLGEDQPFSRHLNEDQESTSQDLLRSTSIKENRTGSRKKAVSPNQSSCFSLGDKIQQQQINQQNIAKHEIQLNCKQLGDMESRVQAWYKQHEHQPDPLKIYPYGTLLTCRQLPCSGSPPYTQVQLVELKSPEDGYKALRPQDVIRPTGTDRNQDNTNKQTANTGNIREKASDKQQQIFTDV